MGIYSIARYYVAAIAAVVAADRILAAVFVAAPALVRAAATDRVSDSAYPALASSASALVAAFFVIGFFAS